MQINTNPWHTPQSHEPATTDNLCLPALICLCGVCLLPSVKTQVFELELCDTRELMHPLSIYNTESRCADTQRQSDWLGSLEDSLCLCKYTCTHTDILHTHIYHMKTCKHTNIHTFLINWKYCRRIHVHPYAFETKVVTRKNIEQNKRLTALHRHPHR